MAIFVLLEQFFGKFCCKYFILILIPSPNMICISLFTRFRFTCAYSVRIIATKEVRNYEKFVFIKTIVKNGRWGDVFPTSPLDPSVCLEGIKGYITFTGYQSRNQKRRLCNCSDNFSENNHRNEMNTIEKISYI